MDECKPLAPECQIDAVQTELRQGLTLVHYSAQLKPFLTQQHTLNIPNTLYHPVNTPETTPNCTPCHTEGS